jgi:colicin import membrane protein
MIVFTATNKVTNEVYVGSARDGMEEQWARLIVQAEEGGAGEFLSAVRDYGSDNFTIEMWSYAESPAESREMVRDACEELSAKLIKTGRAPTPSVETQSQGATESENKPVNVQTLNPNSQTTVTESKVTSLHAPKEEKKVQRKNETEHGPVTSIDVSAYLAEQEQKSADKPEKKAEVVSLRQKDSTKDFDDMKAVMMQIELKRRQNRVSTSTKSKTLKKSTSSSISKTSTLQGKAKASPVKDKLPDGRVSSSAKEKRIKEAIAQEKMEREAAQAAKAAAEAKEMAAIMAKLDQRTKETERIRRRR